MHMNVDKEIKANRPDRIIKDKKENTRIMIDMSMPYKKNVSNRNYRSCQSIKTLKFK